MMYQQDQDEELHNAHHYSQHHNGQEDNDEGDTDDENAGVGHHHQGGHNGAGQAESSVLEYEEEDEEEEEEEEEDEEFQKIRREHVFAEIDFTKRKSKIICTLGPASSETEDIVKLFDAGMSCARLNLSHGNAKVSGNKY